MDENIIDFGSVTCPTKWDDVTLEMFQKLEKYYSKKDEKFDVRNVLDIMCNLTRDEIDALPVNFVEKIMHNLEFLKEQPKYGDASPKIRINDEVFSINVMETLKLGEYVAVDTVLKDDKYNYSAILAILCRKEGEIYDSKFEAELFEQRQKMFAKQPIIKVMPLLSFFLTLFTQSMIISQLSSEVEAELNRIQKNLETSENLGAFKKLYLNLRMKKLRKLLRLSKNI